MQFQPTSAVFALLLASTLPASAQHAGGSAPPIPTPAEQPRMEAAPEEHTHARYSAGSPGDPKKPSRIVEVMMREGDGKMLFVPDHLTVRRNDRVKFVLANAGALDHEFVLATTDENLAHKHFMERHPDMKHDHANGRTVAPGQKVELVWSFDKRGRFEFGCLIPGHREAGMVGRIDVK
ncbi:cupredoxin domain-containing protein [Rhodoplanes azumiensis]|uniref:Plastocyanin/azurin family copper-binding protein n=1 Tax=Rhodoplanes azumiensis TaxID=1897628 RepID=A0ABW5AI22_9BRAD